MTRCGFILSACSKIFSNDVSHNTVTWSASNCFPANLSARNLIWCALSSPLTYSTRRFVNFNMVCKTSVLLPIPGSPPNSVILPGTSPPPKTRFNSVSSMLSLGSSIVEISLRFIGLLFAEVIPPNMVAAPPWRTSLKVFHWPQLGHLPIHLALSCPQFSHTYATFSFAIDLFTLCLRKDNTKM